jgi:hypothetical protein
LRDWSSDVCSSDLQAAGELGPKLSRRFAFGIIPNPDMSGLDNSAYKFQCATLLKFESH